MSNSSILAFDFGTKSIGIASGNTQTHICSEIRPVKAKDGIPSWDAIGKLIENYKPYLVLVGLPLNMDGSEQELTRRARKFGNRIHGRFQTPIEFVDERLSTREAKAEAYAYGHKGNFNQAPVDSIAARILLESWLREQGNLLSH